MNIINVMVERKKKEERERKEFESAVRRQLPMMMALDMAVDDAKMCKDAEINKVVWNLIANKEDI